MHAFIQFITGPLFWISVGICLLGIIFRLFCLYTDTRKKENFMFTFLSARYGLRSIGAWLIPFFPASTRKNPVFYGISYLFHLFLFMVPLFLLSHVALIEEAFGISWVTVNDQVADILTMAVILALIFFAVRRMVVAEVKFLTSVSDYLFICLVGLPFITGFLAYHQIFTYQWTVIVHILSGELMLVLIPFTRFFHMALAPLTRAYMGSEFGAVRHARDW